ncbi:alpha/beta hydrolase [Paucisalibacillus sp. EB02]|uniref:alpha/beta hydrolase n=1 Tax=Paucisalibacillus sp. EB02 TaxID=1347087 RepID=UPI0004B4B057|nr:esterase [Paucisalibacillus sp. EB02]
MGTPLYYKLLKPNKIDSGKTYPAIFLMHGMGSNEDDLLPLVHDLADSTFIFSVRGPIEQPPGYAFFTIEGFGKPHRTVFDQAIQNIISLIGEMCEEHPIDSSQIFLMGFSQGAILSMSIGLKLGQQIKGIAALSGYIPDFMKHDYRDQNLKGLSLFCSHGELDPVLPFDWANEAKDLYNQLGAKVEFHAYTVGHQVSQQNFQDFRNWLQVTIDLPK